MSRITTFKLHRLIGTLKKGEKRSFKLSTKRYNLNSDTSYLKLFDYLDKITEVDLKKFKQKFRGVKGLSGMQTYLYQQILKSLRSQDTYRNIDLVLMEGLAEVEVLYHKNLLEDMEDKLVEIETLAEEYQRILLMPLIYEWWFKMQNTRLRYDNVQEETLEAYEKKYTEIFSILKEYTQSRMQLGRIVFTVKRKYSRQVPELIQGIADNLPPYNSNQQKSVPGTIAELQLRAYLAATMRDNDSAGYYHQQLYDFIKGLPKPLHLENKRIYYHAMGNAISNSKDINQVLQLSRELEEEGQKYLTLYVISSQITAYLSSGLLEECRHCIERFPEDIQYPNKTISTFLQYQIALFYYADKSYDKALDILDTLLLDRSSTSSTNFSSMLKIVILYEQEEYILLTSYLNNVRRNFRKKELLFEFDKRFISLMNKLISLPQKEHKEALIQFRTDLKAFLRAASPLQGEFLLYFNYLDWLDYQIEKKAFKKVCFWTLDSVADVL